jgi:hypothetical protein
MESKLLLDYTRRRRSPATTSGFHRGPSPKNKGLLYPPDLPTVEEIVAVMRAAGDSRRACGCEASSSCYRGLGFESVPGRTSILAGAQEGVAGPTNRL